MTLQGNGNMLIAGALGFSRKARDHCSDEDHGWNFFMGKPASARRPSEHLSAEHYEAFLKIASEDELEYDVLLLSTWRLIR